VSAIADLSEEEKYLLAILQDQSGIDIAELCWTDDTSPDNVFRAWDFQYPWYRTEAKFQIDQCGRAIGKALDVDTPVPVPGGWAAMGALEVGDLVYGLDGKPTRVTHAFEVMHNRECFEVQFSTGETIIADRDHLWAVRDVRMDRNRTVVHTTGELAELGLRAAAQEWRFSIDVAAPVTGLRGIGLPISPWLLGYWLGDGTSRTGQITVGQDDVEAFVEKVEALGYVPNVRPAYPGRAAHVVSLAAPDGTQFGRQLTAIGAKLPDRNNGLQGKTIPPLYLLAGVEDRQELIRGFMDADGSAARKNGRASFDLMDEALARQMMQVAASLGERPSCRVADAKINGRVVGKRYRVGWMPRWFNPFGYKRKADFVRLQSTPSRRSIRAITSVVSRPVRCISVDSPDRLFLVGSGHIPTHNSNGIQMRAFAFPFTGAGSEMLITAPEMIHLEPVTKNVEDRIKSVRLGREFMKRSGTSDGFTHRPFEAKFRNGAKIIGRIPQKDGKGVKGQHPKKLEQDESQDYPEQGWVELGETLKYGDADATWRAHGVSRGVRDRYYKQTQPESGWHVHKYTGMHRPDWTPEEREAKAELYGSRDHPDYRRNILGLHGDAQSALFVLNRLMACVDQDKDSHYNTNEYVHLRINDEKLRDTGMPVEDLLEFPASHRAYGRVWVGMDVGMTNHPSEILVFGEDVRSTNSGPRSNGAPDMVLKALARIHLERVSSPDQRAAMEKIYDFYRPQAFSMDRTGLGLPIYQEIVGGNSPGLAKAMRPYNFSEKIVVGYEKDEDDEFDPDNPYGEPVMANVLEYSSDMLRVLADHKQIRLPWDIDMLREFQGQTYVVTKSTTDAYGKKQFNKGKFHALDAVRMAMLGYFQERIDMLKELTAYESQPVFDEFLV
jgi:hypothetical protein